MQHQFQLACHSGVTSVQDEAMVRSSGSEFGLTPIGVTGEAITSP
jgi:hypothetical protein